MKRILVLSLCAGFTVSANAESIEKKVVQYDLSNKSEVAVKAYSSAGNVSGIDTDLTFEASQSVNSLYSNNMSAEEVQIQELKDADLPVPAYLYEMVRAQYGIETPEVDASRQGGEDIATAMVIATLPHNSTGTTVGYVNDYDEECPYTGSTSPDVVYSYTPAADVTVDMTLCNGSAYDTKMYVYENVYTPAAPFACNDDTCPGWVSELPNLDLIGGNTYYIVIDGYGGDSGAYVLDITEDVVYPVPANDECVDAEAVVAPYPAVVNGTTFGATVDCVGLLDWNAVWYAVELPYAVNTFSASYCGSDPVIANVGIIYYTDCTDCNAYTIADSYAFDCVDGNPQQQSVINGPGTVYFPAYVGTEQDFVLTFDVTEATCEPIICDGTAELEPNYGPGDPLADPPTEDAFGAISCGETVCGTVFTQGDTLRDTDWFELILMESMFVDIDLMVEEFNAQLLFIAGDAETILYSADLGGYCEGETLLTGCLEAGSYYVWVGPNGFTGIDVPANYGVTVTCTPCIIFDPCAEPVVVDCMTTDYAGSTVGAEDFVGNLAPDAFFQFDVTGDISATISLCDSLTDYDTYLRLFDMCPTELGAVEIASNDDYTCEYSSLRSTIADVHLLPGTYWIVVEGYSSNEGNFVMDITCTDFIYCEDTACVPGFTGMEIEAACDSTNDGCNLAVPAFENIFDGDVLCGTAWADGGSRDTDWYELYLDADYTVTLTGETVCIPMDFLFVSGDCVAPVVDFSVSAVEGGGIASVTADVLAGTYYVFAGSSVFEGFVCDAMNPWHYNVGVSMVPWVAPTCDNDDYTTAVEVMGFPYNTTGETTVCTNAIGAYDSTATHCWDGTQFGSSGGSLDAWYHFELATDTELMFSLCAGTSYDSALGLFTDTGLAPVVADLYGGNDDSCGLQSEFTCVLGAGSYYLVVDGYGTTAAGDYTLDITEIVAPCAAITDVAVLMNAGDAELSWTAVAGATDYRVLASVDGYGVYTELGTTGGATTYNDLGAIGAGRRFYQIIAVCE